MMINLASLANANIFATPFKFAVIEEPFIDKQQALRLVTHFPQDHYEYCEHGSGGFRRRPLIVKGENCIHQPMDLDATAVAMGECFLSAEYQQALRQSTGLDLTDSDIEAWFWQYDAQTEFHPHLDQPSKVLTQVFYLVPQWASADGGRLRILNSDCKEDIAYEITPHLGVSTMIFRSANSWHYLTPISETAPCRRNSITVHFHRR